MEHRPTEAEGFSSSEPAAQKQLEASLHAQWAWDISHQQYDHQVMATVDLGRHNGDVLRAMAMRSSVLAC